MTAVVNVINTHFKDVITTMKPKKVILWGRNDVLGNAVESILAAQEAWRVIRVMDDVPGAVFIEQVEAENPDVVIINEGDCACVTPLPAQLMQNRPELKVITISLESNALEVYDKHRIWIRGVSDLLAAIEK